MLTQKQKLEFYENGYIKVPGVVPRLMIDAARKMINHSIGAVGLHEGDLYQINVIFLVYIYF